MQNLAEVNKITVLDACVDGNETRFDRLIGQDFDTFNMIYNVVKNNQESLDCLKVSCTDDCDNMVVRIPTSEKKISNFNLPSVGTAVAITIDSGFLVINTPIKKEWWYKLWNAGY